MGQKATDARERFTNGYFCSQAVLSAFCDELGLDHDMTLKIASGFGGGMGRMGEVCGAVTGAFMVNMEEKNKVSERIRAFTDAFKQRHGSIICRDLIGCDIGIPEGYQEAADKGLFVSICRPLVEDAAAILEETL
jgi:C_GCAxxG_C_C family probable redox protein